MYKQINSTNCKNCGGILHYHDKKAICEYCKTEYHLDNLGRLEEYKVELEIFGKRLQFYISEITCEPIYSEFRRLSDGTIFYREPRNNIKLELIST